MFSVLDEASKTAFNYREIRPKFQGHLMRKNTFKIKPYSGSMECQSSSLVRGCQWPHIWFVVKAQHVHWIASGGGLSVMLGQVRDFTSQTRDA